MPRPLLPRRLRPVRSLALAAAAFALAAAPAVPAAAPAARPNIVYVIADDLGYGDVQALNPDRGRIATPHLDRLAAQGLAFTDAHSGSSVCTPTRYGLLTGRYAWRTRLQRGVLDGADDDPLIASDRLTLPAFLRQQGYTTAAIGKWHLGFRSERPAGAAVPAKEGAAKGAAKGTGKKSEFGRNGLPVGSRIVGGPTTRGFDYFWGCSNARTMAALIENDRVIEDLPPIDMLPRLEKRAVDYIAENAVAARSGRPFFLYLPLTSPHTPILPTREWQGKSGLGAYADFVQQTDAVVGRILAALETAGLAGNTLVVFTADNGCSPQADTPGLEKQGHFASAGLRGYKADIWEGGHRVPFLVRWPGQVRAGTRSDRLLCLTDFFATCAELVGTRLPADAGEDSVSFLPTLLGRADIPPRGPVVHHSINGQFALRDGPWKLAFCPGSGGWGKPSDADARAQGLPERQLYRLDRDLAETRNLQAENPEVVARLTARLQALVDEGRSTPGPRRPNDVAVRFPPPAP